MNAHMNRLPQMREDIKRLQEQIEELRKQIRQDYMINPRECTLESL